LHQVDYPGPPAAALTALASVAEDGGAEWRPEGEGGELILPVVAGLRRGVAAGRITVTRAGAASRISYDVTGSELRVQRPAVVILTVALAAAVLGMLWPFFPALISVAPWAAAIVLSAWLLVVARLRSAGAEEFLRAVAHEGEAGAGNP
jgi:hypothetical protein